MATSSIKQNEDTYRKTAEAANTIGDKAKHFAETATDKAKEAVSSLGDKAEQATHAVGSGLESLAGTVREKMPHSGVLGTASSSVASGLEAGGKFIQEEGLKGMADDVTNLIRRNPIPALLIAAALGYFVARATSRS